MYLNSNIKFLRNYTRTTQEQFGKLFGKTRSNIDSYERGNAKPDEAFQKAVADHFNISLEVLLYKDLVKNPGLMFSGSSVNDQHTGKFEDLIKAKDETIKELKAQVKYLQEQYNQLLKKLKVA
jgi:transcriptional regulator with XRE-family HTH domain